MAEILEQKCPCCGAMMRYDPKESVMICDYCDTKLAVMDESKPSETAGKDDFDFHSFEAQVTDINAEDLPIYNCVSCGAEVIAAPEQFALTCPYCRNNIVLSNKISGKLRPDGVVPFRIESKELPEKLRRFYKDKVLLPKRFFSEAKMENITGVYVPFWVFNGRIYGTLEYEGTTQSTRYSGDYTFIDTKHFAITRSVSAEYDGLPVDASGKIDDAMMDSLEPFDLKDLKPFNVGYLAGFTADRFDVPAKNMESRANERMVNTTSNLVRNSVSREYSNVTFSGSNLMRELTAKYLLLPVYLFNLSYEGRNYKFAVNGQTGKTVGEVPTGKRESKAYFWRRLGILAGSILLLALVLYLLGR